MQASNIQSYERPTVREKRTKSGIQSQRIDLKKRDENILARLVCRAENRITNKERRYLDALMRWNFLWVSKYFRIHWSNRQKYGRATKQGPAKVLIFAQYRFSANNERSNEQKKLMIEKKMMNKKREKERKKEIAVVTFCFEEKNRKNEEKEIKIKSKKKEKERKYYQKKNMMEWNRFAIIEFLTLNRPIRGSEITNDIL